VKKLDDFSLDQPYISPDDFYTRYNYEHKARIIEVCSFYLEVTPFLSIL
jgi:hypothetical protein